MKIGRRVRTLYGRQYGTVARPIGGGLLTNMHGKVFVKWDTPYKRLDGTCCEGCTMRIDALAVVG